MVMMTAHGSTQIVREAFKLGVEDFLEKPFEVDELLALARRAVRSQRLQTEKQYLISERDAEFNHYGIVGRSRAMQEVLQRAELVAQTKSTVLVTGETGTGKEMVARAIHHRSAQRDMPLIKVNCAAIPETLLESELFGHVRGAFTGATMTKRGKFALADGGSIFLDEIGTMSHAPCRRSCCACCRSASSSRSARSARRRSTCASSPRPIAISSRWSATASSRRTCTTA